MAYVSPSPNVLLTFIANLVSSVFQAPALQANAHKIPNVQLSRNVAKALVFPVAVFLISIAKHLIDVNKVHVYQNAPK
jgi:predicted transcriptional regulator